MNTVDHFLHALKCAELTWMPAKHGHAIYEVVYEGNHVKMRVNDFPDEVPVTLFVGDEEIDVEEVPLTWHFFSEQQT